MNIIKRLVLIYGIGAIMFAVYFGCQIHFKTLYDQSGIDVTNRESVMGLFFERWDYINAKYNNYGHDKSPRWYKLIQDPMFIMPGKTKLEREINKSKAEKYINANIKDAAGIDSKWVKTWLFEIIDLASYEKLENAEQLKSIFCVGKTNDNLNWGEFYELKLRQALYFIPLGTHWHTFKDIYPITLSIFPVLFGLPLLFIQGFVSTLNLFKRKKQLIIGLSLVSIKRIAIFSSIIGAIGLFVVAKAAYESASLLNFIEGKYMWLEYGILGGIAHFIVAFLTLWSIRILCDLLIEDVKYWQNIYKKATA